jgi:cell division protein FtsQ
VGWDTYKTINIKYTNQIVCEKNKIDSVALRAQLKKDAADSAATKAVPIDSIIRADIRKQISADKEEAKTNTRKNK